MANGIDFGIAVGLIKGIGSPNPAVIESAVDGWLDDHPEATTTVQDGSITKVKLDSNLQGTVDDVADLKSQIGDLENITYKYVEVNRNARQDQWRLNFNGYRSYNASYDLNKYSVTAGTLLRIVSDDKFQFQTSDTVTSSGTLYRVGDTYGDGTFIMRVPATATYLIVSTTRTGSNASVSIVGNYVDLSNVSLSPGYLDENGKQRPADSNAPVCSPRIFGLSKLFLTITFSSSLSNSFSICAYGDDGFISRKTDYPSGVKHIVSYECPEGTSYIRFSFRTGGNTYTKSILGVANVVNLSNGFNTLFSITDDQKYPALGFCDINTCIDHLFVNHTVVITYPSESLYHVRVSKALGFNMIEANIQTTSDGVYFVHHLANNRTFGGYFTHVDGVTDISNIAANTVTWDWIAQNVRYNSTIPKFRTRPVLLSEFLEECKRQNLYVLFTAETDDIIEVVRKHMGRNMYIAYGATRAQCPTEIITHWRNTENTKEAIVNYCKSVGAPFIYGLSQPGNFTDEQLKEIVEAVHENGFLISAAYQDDQWYKLRSLGFDLNSATAGVNRIEKGNLYNYGSMTGFGNYTVTNATETNGVLTFGADGTIVPNVDNTVYDLAMIDVELWFNGTVTINGIGEMVGNLTLTSDGSDSVFRSIPIVGGSIKPTINVTSGTTVYDVTFRASAIFA